ncbi:MAG: flagellar protein FhlB [Gammaproteobacteria bacterium]|nr:flagellar protein FhlB [Gammaproteobacteria bacterium]
MKERNTDVAVALKYGGKGAPRVTAKGRGQTAENILALAEEAGVPLWKDASLADVLAQVDLDDEIPAPLYRAVAEVIAFAWQFRGDLDPPPPSDDISSQARRY